MWQRLGQHMKLTVTEVVRGLLRTHVKRGGHLICWLHFNFLFVCMSVPVASLCEAIFSMRIFQCQKHAKTLPFKFARCKGAAWASHF